MATLWANQSTTRLPNSSSLMTWRSSSLMKRNSAQLWKCRKGHRKISVNLDWDQYKCAAMNVKRGPPQAEELTGETGRQHTTYAVSVKSNRTSSWEYRSTSNKIQETTRRTTTKEFLQMVRAMLLTAIWDVQYNVDAINVFALPALSYFMKTMHRALGTSKRLIY